MRVLAFIATLLLAVPVASKDLTDDQIGYVQSNTRAIFYHELGHALIDLLNIPIFGQEEDAADVLSVLMIDELFEEEAAEAIAYDVAYNFLSDASEVDELAFWDVHGLDEQRAYTFICIFYGYDVDTRDGFAEDFNLPEERAESCEEERELAQNSWGMVLDGIIEDQNPSGLTFAPIPIDLSPAETVLTDVVREEVADLERWVKLPAGLLVKVESCDEPNAFYDPSEQSITMCTEFADYLAKQVE
jgi:hypothetical protein